MIEYYCKVCKINMEIDKTENLKFCPLCHSKLSKVTNNRRLKIK